MTKKSVEVCEACVCVCARKEANVTLRSLAELEYAAK